MTDREHPFDVWAACFNDSEEIVYLARCPTVDKARAFANREAEIRPEPWILFVFCGRNYVYTKCGDAWDGLDA